MKINFYNLLCTKNAKKFEAQIACDILVRKNPESAPPYLPGQKGMTSSTSGEIKGISGVNTTTASNRTSSSFVGKFVPKFTNSVFK